MINLGVKKGLMTLAALTLIGLFLSTLGGLWLAHSAADVARHIYVSRTAPAGFLMQAVDALHRARQSILMAVSEENETATQSHLKHMANLENELNNALNAYVKAVPDQKAAIHSLEGLILNYNQARDQSVMMISVGDLPSALENIKSNAGPKFDKVLAALTEIINTQTRAAREDYKANEALLKTQSSIQWGLALLTLAIIAWSFFVIIRSISAPLDRLRRVMVDSQHSLDLTRRAEVTRQDEIGQTALAYNSLMEAFQGMLGEVHASTRVLAEMAGELSAAAQQAARASETQSESATSIAASIEEMSVSVTSISDHAQAAAQQSNQARSLASEGSALVTQLLMKIEHVSGAVRHSAESIDNLGQRSREINNITRVITDIADQTNLLALNAAIEAARAGESGRGFAVVADEVRRLAERSALAAKDISTLIGHMLASTTDVMEQMKREVRDVDEEAALSVGTGKAIEGISYAAVNSANAISEVSAAISEQGTTSQDVARHIESIANMTEQNSTAVAQTAQAAIRLGAEAERLRSMVVRFRIA